MNERLDQLRSMLSEDPNDVFIHYAIALELFKASAVEDAIGQLQSIIEQHADYIPAYFRLGQWYAEQDQVAQALEILSKGLDLAKSQKDDKAAQEIQELILFIEDYED